MIINKYAENFKIVLFIIYFKISSPNLIFYSFKIVK